MEYLDIVDEQNNLTGKTEERDIIHEKGLWHREISVWIMNQKGEVLLQKRSPNKKQGANNWSICAGHVDIGEQPIIAAVREIKEELGLIVQKNELKELFVEKSASKLPNSYNNIFSYKYFLKTNTPIDNYKIDKNEVSEIKYISLEELEQLMKDKPANYPFVAKSNMVQILPKLKEYKNT